MIEIKTWTGATVLSVDAETLTDADLRGADLRGADLCGANLTDANLRGANLTCANLTGANLTCANLTGTNLTCANLTCANLTGANLTNANLTYANLTNANLTYANLTNANLTGANLTGANLTTIRASLAIEFDPELPARIVEQIAAHPESHDQSTWHSECGTRHCIAGFATQLSGPLGRYLDRQLSTPTAATLLLWRPDCEMPSFASDATTEETLGRLKAMAAAAERDAAIAPTEPR